MKSLIHVLLLACTIAVLNGGAVFAADAEHGEKIFDGRCKMCHSVRSGVNKIGPSLDDIMGRKAGTVPGFNYSPALKNSGVVWNDKTLNDWLAKANPLSVYLERVAVDDGSATGERDRHGRSLRSVLGYIPTMSDRFQRLVPGPEMHSRHRAAVTVIAFRFLVVMADKRV